MERDGRFPRRFKLSEGGRATGWWEDEVLAWQAARDATRNAPKAA
jgi:predicted DNA-binding transcriptional regulator AlpA